MRDLVTTLLDAIGLLAIAIGAGGLAACAVAALCHDRATAATAGMLGTGALIGGLVLTAGSVLAASRRAPAPPAGDQR